MLKINFSSGKKKENEFLQNQTKLTLNVQDVMCQTNLEENLYWLSNEHRKIRKSR